MKEKDKNRKTESSDFLRYMKGNMSDQERNAFERELQKDPFAEEAAEGLTEISPEEASRDLTELGKKLKKRISRRQRFVYYRIAASVAVLMIITSVFYIAKRSRPEKEISEISMNQVTFDIPESKKLQEPPDQIQEREYLHAPAQEKKAGTPVQQKVKEIPEETDAIRIKKLEAAEKSETIIQTEVKAADIIIPEKRIAAPVAASSREKSKVLLVKGKVLSSEDNLPLAGVNITVKGTRSGAITDTGGNFNIALPDEKNNTLIANFIGMESKEFRATGDTDIVVKLDPSVMGLSEVVVVGYGTAGKEDAVQTGYSPPAPVTGRRSFDRYIEENIKNPGTLSAGQKAIVVISFTVRCSGIIDSIKVIRSPGIEFSEEALRLIKNGPSWKPAEEGGNKIDDEVRVRIVFK